MQTTANNLHEVEEVTQGQFDSAVRRAFNLFDKWNDVTGFVPKDTSYYYELQACIEDAVHCGAQAATGDFRDLTAKGQHGYTVSRRY